MQIGRRQFLGTCIGGTVAASLPIATQEAHSASQPAIQTRGVVLVPEDLTLSEWPKLAKDAGLTTIGLHHGSSPAQVVRCMQSEPGQRFFRQCRDLGLEVEYELHAIKELLPRSLFDKAPEMFRMNENGDRVPDANCCVHSAEALDILCANAVSVAKTLRPTTGRYFYWGDDGTPWCDCPKCKELIPSEQALIIENRFVRTLRQVDPKAQVAHLAYHNTLAPPKNVKPAPGVFLEFAPIHRRYDVPYEEQKDPRLVDGLHALDANLNVFPTETTQVLEYWLDVSRFSRWKRPGSKLPWNNEVFLSDIDSYRKRGITHVTTFAAWIDADYRERFGDLSFIEAYGRGLSKTK